MGDRANVEMKQHGKPEDASSVFLYTHWSGTDLPKILQAGRGVGRTNRIFAVSSSRRW